MSHNEVCFNVYHGGYWVKDYNGEFAYLNGEEMIRIECIPEDVFNRMSTELREGLYGQKIWYKLPYDDFKDRKSLSNEDVSFQKMCEAGKWTGFVDLYVVTS
ncbi:hypothetical protein ISN44_As08g026620 [Arabidopsis suecica]|uniref:Uncharacterized protein n=1 Tax=Arabidopsis suecica TaxID=45249 RepID=A0A8T2B7R2_ARASU|nr:hypothetical protein ISN44_As08g026620 [Arabidopsis suecica]